MAGYSNDLESAAYLVDLDTGATNDLLKGERIEVLRFSLDLNQERILIYGLDLARNQPVLAEYDIRFDVLEATDINVQLASSFQPADLSLSHVPPSVTVTPPEPSVEVTVLSEEREGAVSIDFSGTPRFTFVDFITVDFGDGSEALEIRTFESETNPLATSDTGRVIEYTYETPGTYSISVTMVTDLGGEATTEVEVTISATSP